MVQLKFGGVAKQRSNIHACTHGLFFMYRSLVYVIFTCNLRPLRRYCNVGWCGKLKAVQCTTGHQQCLVAEWLGLSVTDRVRARAREWNFSIPFFCPC